MNGQVRLDDFLAVLFPTEDEAIYLRAFKPKEAPDTSENFPVKRSATRRQLREAKELQAELKKLNLTRGLYLVINSGGDKDEDIRRFNAFFAEDDSRPLEEQHARLDSFPIQTSVRVETKKSVHAYWLLRDCCSGGDWSDVQSRLIDRFACDPKIKNPSRVMRIPLFNHVSWFDGEYAYKRVEITEFDPSRIYSLEDMLAVLPKHEERHQEAIAHQAFFYSTWEELNAEAGRRIRTHPTARKRADGWVHCKGICHNGKSDSAIAISPSGAYHCQAGCPTAAMLLALGLPERPQSQGGHQENGSAIERAPREQTPWPVLQPEALHGLAGDLVRVILPHTESDPVALLVQFVVAFGNVIGRNAHFVADGAWHYLNLFCILVGLTAKGRKGTSWMQSLRIFREIDELWAKDRIEGGLSTGEGLIWAVRDEIVKTEPVRENKRIVGYQEVKTDPGVSDKRLLIFESEFAMTLKVMERDGCTLSATLRQCWDTGNLRILNKNSPAKATGAHVSIVGHITKEELLRSLTSTDTSNGFANRFLWLCVKRSKCLPEGGRLHSVDLSHLLSRLGRAIELGRRTTEMMRDEQARAVWLAVYPSLSEGEPGLFGSVTSRAEAQVTRLACIYALLDEAAVVSPCHIEAALALWQYCEDSAKYIFGTATGDPLADKLLSALRSTPDGMSRTDMSVLLHRNCESSRIDSALVLLERQGLARSAKIGSGTPGRTTERWFAVMTHNEINEINEFSPDQKAASSFNSFIS